MGNPLLLVISFIQVLLWTKSVLLKKGGGGKSERERRGDENPVAL